MIEQPLLNLERYLYHFNKITTDLGSSIKSQMKLNVEFRTKIVINKRDIINFEFSP